ncbi:MAG: hypothetical protein RLZZ387_1813 [Chloroflexota bacterium]|jgi:uncharacterized damage-inducible protein DinB
MIDVIRRAGPAALADQARDIAAEVRSSYAGLSHAQLNWKPNPEAWSVGQCFEHMLIANSSYVPTFEERLSGRRGATAWERLPLLPGVFGRMLVSTLNPEFKGHVEAPPVFRPTSSDIDTAVVGRFLDGYTRLIDFLGAHGEAELRRLIIASPASKVITYSALDACRIIVVHTRRHLAQVDAVMRLPGFPAT